MRIPENVTAFGTVVALILGGTSLYLDLADRTVKVQITQTEDGGGDFYATRNGVAQEVSWDLVNLSSFDVVLSKLEFSPNNVFPAPLKIDGVYWDGQPFTLQSNTPYRISYIALRDFEFLQTDVAKQALVNRKPFLNPWIEIQRNYEDELQPTKTFDLLHNPLGIAPLPDTLESEDTPIFLYRRLLEKGYFFDGSSARQFPELRTSNYYVQFGGVCQTYTSKLPNVCTLLEVTLATGEKYHSDYISFGVRSDTFPYLLALEELRREEDK